MRALPGLGDFLCSVPAFKALRSAFPIAQIGLIGLPTSRHLIDRFRHYIDQWFEFPGFPGIPEVPFAAGRTVAFLHQMQQLKFDLALQMHGNGSVSNCCVQLLAAAEQAGFFQPGYFCPDPERFAIYPEHLPEVRRNLHLLNFLGIPLQGEQLEFPLREADWQEWRTIVTAHSLSRNYICIHPGASVAARRWNHRHFAFVADALAAQGFQIVLTGTATEANLTQAVAQAMRFPAIDLAGKTHLGSLAALLKKSRLLVCNDTGISHLADALKVDSVVIFLNSDPHRWAPLDEQRHRIVQINPDLDRRLNPDLDRSQIAPASSTGECDRVLAEAVDLLNREVAYAS